MQGTLKSALTSQRGNVQCVPRQPYQPFPEELHPPGEGGLVVQIQALPSSLGELFVIIIVIIMKNFNRPIPMVTMAQSTVNWCNTYTHMDCKHSLTHLHQHSYNHMV